MSGGDPLAGLPRPPGDPGAAHAAARRYSGGAEHLDTCAHQILSAVRGIAGGDWIGTGSMSAVGCTVVLAGAFARAGAAARTAAGALNQFGQALATAQAQWDHARRLADEAVRDEADYRARADAQAQQLMTQAATHADLGAAHAAQSIRADAASYQSPLRAQSVSLATTAIEDARIAGQQGAAHMLDAVAMVPTPPPAPSPVGGGSKGGGGDPSELFRWFNEWVLGGGNTAAAYGALPPALYAGGRWALAARDAAGLPRELQTLFDETVGPLALAADRGLLPWSAVAQKASDFQGAATLFGNATDEAVNGSRLSFLRGGLPSGGGWELAGKGLGVFGVVGDVGVLIDPGGDSATEDTVNRGAAVANGVSTVLVLNAATDEIPVAGEVVMVGSGVYLGGDWLYHHWTPFHDGVDATGHFVTSTVPHFVTDTVPNALGDAASTAGHVLHDAEPWHWHL